MHLHSANFTGFLIIISIVLISFMSFTNANGQHPVSLIVKDKTTNLSVIGATAEIYSSADSVLIKADIADTEGKFTELILHTSGAYFIKISMLGYQTFSKSIYFNNEPLDLGTIYLEESSVQLDQITVKAQKPFLERKVDRMIVNVENSIMSEGSTVYEVLVRSPGILIDPNDNISMRGKNGIIVYIDGRQSPLNGTDLINYLKSLPSGSISRIELITNPSSRYDAAGSAGIIDIKMKKDIRHGINGSVSASYGQGVYPKSDAGLNLNFRNKFVNLYGSYNYGYRLGLNHLILDRKFYDNFIFSGKDEKENYTKIPVHFHNIRLGMDYFIDEKTILGFTYTPNFSNSSPYNRNTSKVFNAQRENIFDFNTNTTNDNSNNSGVVNFNVKRNLSKAGSEITLDVDFGRFLTRGDSENKTRYFSTDGSVFQPDYQLNGNQEGILKFSTAKTDYLVQISESFKLETGIKFSYVSSDQDAAFFEKKDDIFIPDINKTNHFIYRENNNAGYINLNKNYKKFEFQLGLRGEHTSYSTRQLAGDITFDSSYFKLFPTFFVQYKIDDTRSITANMTRRIDRPGFSQLNPFLFLIDVTTYATGNPALQPQFSWNGELGYSDKILNVTLSYSKTLQAHTIVLSRLSDVFPDLSEDPNVTIQIPLNLQSTENVGLDVSAPFQLNKWWSGMASVSGFYNHFTGDLSGTSLNKGNFALFGNTNHKFLFKNDWSSEITFSYNSGNRSGYLIFKPQWALGLGIQKKILKGNGTLRFNITDIFWTNLPNAQIAFDNYIEDWNAFRETRVATLGFSYRFGNSKVQQARRRTTGSEEERRRIGNG